MKIENRGLLSDVLPEDCFELSNGEVVGNLRELIVALKKMNDEEFSLHVYGEQNDFAEWIIEGFWNENLAGKILGIKDRKKMIKFLEKVLKKAEKERFFSKKKKDVLNKISEMN